jgi:hypothetical protein
MAEIFRMVPTPDTFRILKKAVQQGRSERSGEAYVRYVESLSEARTPLADFFIDGWSLVSLLCII